MEPTEARRAIFGVTQLNGYIKSVLEGDMTLSDLYLRGEISNFVRHRSGHLYFSLKDESGAVRAVMFRSSAVKLPFSPQNGMKVIAAGSVSVFTRDGNYQLYVRSLEPDGVGALALAFEQLRRKLEAEGLFAPERKKPFPKIPLRIGIVTSPTGAAIRDILQVLSRRFPMAKVLLYPATVQGEGAAESLIRGISHFHATRGADVIIIGRGGGSMEDLWAFNNEDLARCIAACSIPVISAVGHERDFTICDFVADFRAPTPSAAAEVAVPEAFELKRKIQNITEHMRLLLNRRHQQMRRELLLLSSHRGLSDPERSLRENRLVLDRQTERLSMAEERIRAALRRILSEKAAKLDALSPLGVLVRGYALVSDEKGKLLRSVSKVKEKDVLKIQLQDGVIRGEVLSAEKNG